MKSPPIVIWIWYRGDAFSGFQGQRSLHTVQGSLQQALYRIGVISAPVGAGRTDKGVHARMQVVRVRAATDAADLVEKLTSHLPPGLGVCVARAVARPFHPQWSSIAKEYRYRLSLSRAPPEWEPFSWNPREDPRLSHRAPRPETLSELLAIAKGTRDFIAFHEKSSARRPRTLQRAEVVETSDGILEIRLRGDAFGRYQARYLVGSAVAAATGAVSVEQYRAGIERAVAFSGVKAPAQGLVLWEIAYPPGLDPFLPQERQQPPGLPGKPPFADR
ncbi:MAG TPA: tRNA pseudouridine(38-40) synthase TruA [Myxococcaceae bacterium]|nr:tRNA pseudouridine(38-40) synthase TruA [Myxococcaceae bacterium]